MENFAAHLKEYLEDPENLERARIHYARILAIEEIESKQRKRFHDRNLSDEEFSVLVEKVRTKYFSDEYRDRWYEKGIEPQEYLLFFLFEYAEEYGVKCSRDD